MGKYLIGWVAFIFTLVITVKLLDPEYFANQRLDQVMANLASAQQAQDSSQQAYYYGQALSELSKLKRQFADTQVYQRIFVSDELNVGLIQAQYNRLLQRPWQVAEPSYFRQALSLIASLDKDAQLANMVALAPAVKRVTSLDPDFIDSLLQRLDESSDINLRCQAYQLLASRNTAQDKHRHLESIDQVLIQPINQQLQQTCVTAYFDVASQMSYLSDLQTLSERWQIPLAELQLSYTEALIANGFFSLAKKQQQALEARILQAEIELLLLTEQWPGFTQTQRKEQALLDVGISLVNLAEDEQSQVLLMQLLTFLFSHNELAFAAGFRTRIKSPMDKVIYQALDINTQDRLKPNSVHLERLPQLIDAFVQNRDKLQSQLGFHELMDIWLNKQIMLSEQTVMGQIADLLYRHYETHPEQVQPWLDELSDYQAIALAQSAIELGESGSLVDTDDAMALLVFIRRQQAPDLVRLWLAQVGDGDKLSGLIWLANQAKSAY